jgi:maleylpyruvate isomerase
VATPGTVSVGLVLGRLAAATDGLVAGLGGLSEAGARGASRLPGWSRGHVLSHLARNAEGSTRLLVWARTGVPGHEYESVAARAAAIEAGAGRPAAVLAADVRASARALAEAAAAVPDDGWDRLVTWTTGQQTPAVVIVTARLTEVLVHHVDLELGFGPADWPDWFVAERTAAVAGSLTRRGLHPLTARLHAADSGRRYRLGPAGPGDPEISGSGADLLAWLLGRGDGSGLTGPDPGPLPAVPSVYVT